MYLCYYACHALKCKVRLVWFYGEWTKTNRRWPQTLIQTWQARVIPFVFYSWCTSEDLNSKSANSRVPEEIFLHLHPYSVAIQ